MAEARGALAPPPAWTPDDTRRLAAVVLSDALRVCLGWLAEAGRPPTEGGPGDAWRLLVAAEAPWRAWRHTLLTAAGLDPAATEVALARLLRQPAAALRARRATLALEYPFQGRARWDRALAFPGALAGPVEARAPGPDDG